MTSKFIIFISVLMSFSPYVNAEKTAAPSKARVYFVNLKHGQTVSSPFKVIFGLSGMGVAPAGIDKKVLENVGHHHLFVNKPLTSEITEGVIPSDEHHLHFGQGQTETLLNLPPGKHTLQLVFGDPYHSPHNPVVASEVISVNVQTGE